MYTYLFFQRSLGQPVPDVRACFCPWFTYTPLSALLIQSFSQVQAGGHIGLGYFRFSVNAARARSRPWLVRASWQEAVLKAQIAVSEVLGRQIFNPTCSILLTCGMYES